MTTRIRRLRPWLFILAAAAMSFAFAARPVAAEPAVAEASKTTAAKDSAAKDAGSKSAAADSSFDNGCRVFICGHSFHIFNAKHLGPIAELADLDDHKTVGSQMLGGSSVTQHWNLPDEKNKVKQALKAGQVDVMTMSPNWVIPDPAIEKFVDLGLEHNPRMRFVVQMSWTARDGSMTNGIKSLEERDSKTMAELRPPQELFAKAIEAQVAEINAKHDHPVVFISPVGYAVLKLREAVIEGKVPGVKKQSDLYLDLLGHGQPPIMVLCSYVNFATIYRRSPEGLAPFNEFNGQVPAELHKLLQQIAWETVTTYKPSGVTAAAATR